VDRNSRASRPAISSYPLVEINSASTAPRHTGRQADHGIVADNCILVKGE
jgi:hypothetical protein